MKIHQSKHNNSAGHVGGAAAIFLSVFLAAPSGQATDIHAEWSHQHIANLFPEPMGGWAVSELTLEESDTITSGFESFVGGLSGIDAGVSIRLKASRRYSSTDRAITIFVDSADIEMAASIEAIAAAHKTDDGLRAELAESGVKSISYQKYSGFSAQEDDRAGMAFKVGSAGIVVMECDYTGCAEDLAAMKERLDLAAFERFTVFDHRK